jgi:hypothetical protein
MYDAGLLRMEGTPDRPTFFGANGEPLGERRRHPPDAARDPPLDSS